MICVAISQSSDLSYADKVIAISVHRARTVGSPNINIVFVGMSTSDVFNHRDMFTKYIDIGVKVYIEHSNERVRQIILESCKEVYIPSSDELLHNLLRDVIPSDSVKIQQV